MKKKCFLVMLFTMFNIVVTAHASSAAGTYSCWMFHVNGSGGGRCSLPALVLNGNGTYTLGSEQGTYKANGSGVILSKSQFRGTGRFQEGGHQIVFRYNYQGRNHEVTYLKR